MERRYTRLKWKLLLLVLAGAAAACLGGWLLLRLASGPFERLFLWVAAGLFGKSEPAALALYEAWILGPKHIYLTAAVALILLAAFYLAMGPFTRWLDQIGRQARQVAEGEGGAVALPKELAPIQADLTSLQTALRQREEQAKAEEQRKNDLLVFLAHDLKTPMTSVIGYLTLLKDDPELTAEQRAKYTGIALDKALRLEDLMLEFFEITRESLHQSDAEPVEIHLSMLLEQLADEFWPQLREKELICHTDISPHLQVMGDGDKLARVFENVLRNAVNYSDPGGTVELAALQRGEAVTITVRNEGLAIPEGELARIFEKFYRLDSARSTRTGGAGLGLAIAKEIVESHGGTIHAESDGQKTAFVIILPAARTPRQETPSPAASPPPA